MIVHNTRTRGRLASTLRECQDLLKMSDVHDILLDDILRNCSGTVIYEALHIRLVGNGSGLS